MKLREALPLALIAIGCAWALFTAAGRLAQNSFACAAWMDTPGAVAALHATSGVRAQ